MDEKTIEQVHAAYLAEKKEGREAELLPAFCAQPNAAVILAIAMLPMHALHAGGDLKEEEEEEKFYTELLAAVVAYGLFRDLNVLADIHDGYKRVREGLARSVAFQARLKTAGETRSRATEEDNAVSAEDSGF